MQTSNDVNNDNSSNNNIDDSDTEISFKEFQRNFHQALWQFSVHDQFKHICGKIMQASNLFTIMDYAKLMRQVRADYSAGQECLKQLQI